MNIIVISCVLLAHFPGKDFDVKQAKNRPPVVLTEEGKRIHFSSLLIDGHNDLLWKLRDKPDRDMSKLDISKSQPELHTDIERLKKGGLGAQFWSVYIPATPKDRPMAAEQLKQIDLVYQMVERYPVTFEMAYTADDVLRVRKSGRIASLIGIEGGGAIENSLELLRNYYRLGVRYMTLTHSETLDWVDSATDQQLHGGLTGFGEEVVREMNRLGMLVDIAHVSHETMKDVLRVSRAPIIASHSSAFAVAPHARNVPDEILRGVKKNGGVVMVNFASGFVVAEGAKVWAVAFDVWRECKQRYKNDEKKASAAWKTWQEENPIPPGTVHDLVDHIDHIVEVAGIDHVGIGSDYDGISKVPVQLEDVSSYPYITQELLNRGYSEEDIKKVLGNNVLRALRGVESARD